MATTASRCLSTTLILPGQRSSGPTSGARRAASLNTPGRSLDAEIEHLTHAWWEEEAAGTGESAMKTGRAIRMDTVVRLYRLSGSPHHVGPPPSSRPVPRSHLSSSTCADDLHVAAPVTSLKRKSPALLQAASRDPVGSAIEFSAVRGDRRCDDLVYSVELGISLSQLYPSIFNWLVGTARWSATLLRHGWLRTAHCLEGRRSMRSDPRPVGAWHPYALSSRAETNLESEEATSLPPVAPCRGGGPKVATSGPQPTPRMRRLRGSTLGRT